MLLEIAFATLLGILAGIITGLFPGIHINLVSVLVVSFSAYLLEFVSLPSLGVFIIAMSITHTFLDVIPSIFLGAPEAETAMAVLPGHQLLLEGKGYEAVKLTIFGSFFGLILALIMFPLFLLTFAFLYEFLQPYIGYLLIIIMAFMISIEKSISEKAWSLAIFLLSGVLGLLVLTMPNLKQPLFPLLSGLFGTSMLIVSLFEKTRIPKQKISDSIQLSFLEKIKSIGAGTFSGSFVSFFPGLGPAQAAVIGNALVGKVTNYSFLILVGAIGTVNMVVSLVSLYTIEKARNGAVLAIMQLMEVDASLFVLFVVVSLIAAGIAVILSLYFANVFCRIIEKVNYSYLCIGVIFLIVFLVFYFSSWIGVLILMTATAIGIIPNVRNVKRSHSMGCLILPVILFFVL